jgi:hypothetical protein
MLMLPRPVGLHYPPATPDKLYIYIYIYKGREIRREIRREMREERGRTIRITQHK